MANGEFITSLDLGSENGRTHSELKAWEGSTILLNVNTESVGNKLVAVWSRNGDIVPHLENYYEYGKTPRGLSIRIPFAQIQDSGIWIVEVYDRNTYNIHRPDVKSCLISVIQKTPEMVERVEIVGELGKQVVLETESGSNSVQWRLPNRTIITGGSTFELSNLTYHDSGKYTATYENGKETAEKIFIVDVEGVPDSILGLKVKDKGDKLEVSWTGCCFDGGSSVDYYVVSYKDKEIHTTRLSVTIEKDRCNPESQYVFRVAAANKHGVGKRSTIEYNDRIDLQTEGFENYRKLEELGKGRFGTVFRVERDGQSFAGKFIKCIRAQDREKAKSEIEILTLVQGHEKLVQILAAYQLKREIVIITELLGGGELFERIVADDFNLTENKCREFMRDILQGIEYVHHKSIVHLDIKPENILITPAGLKIIDFGLSQKYDPNEKQCVLFGTPEFVSPEIINYEPIGFYCDIWSIGVLTYVLISGLSPFMGDSDSETLANVTRGEFDFEDDAFDEVGQECLAFIRGCLAMPNTNRLTATKCLEHSWMQQNTDAEIKKDKLKRFVLRRKWQKTGNAIRAIGRLKSRCSTASTSSGNEDS